MEIYSILVPLIKEGFTIANPPNLKKREEKAHIVEATKAIVASTMPPHNIIIKVNFIEIKNQSNFA